MPAGRRHEAFLTADANAETIELVERHPRVRDRAIFIGDAEDVVPDPFGPGLPGIREWTERHYRFAGYIPGFDPASVRDRAALREELAMGDEPWCVISVGGSGFGLPLLRRVIDSLALVREEVPDLRALAVAGRASIPRPSRWSMGSRCAGTCTSSTDLRRRRQSPTAPRAVARGRVKARAGRRGRGRRGGATRRAVREPRRRRPPARAPRRAPRRAGGPTHTGRRSTGKRARR
jgi:hypothetical protein